MTDGIMGLFGKKKTEATSASSLEFVSDRESAAVNAAVGKTGDTAKHAVGETLNGSASESLWDGFAEGMKEAFSSACDFLSDLMPDCIKNIDWRGIWGNVTSFLSDAMGFVMKGLSSMGSSAGSWAGSAASWIGSFFAEGGVMTPYGKATLQKYARGGIADRPQIALFGEGSMNEAYVPLPDGRSIPVTLSGSGTGGNVVNISIQVNNEMREDGLSSSNEVQSASGNAAGWNKFADSIKSMIVSEIANQSRPGGLLYDGHR